MVMRVPTAGQNILLSVSLCLLSLIRAPRVCMSSRPAPLLPVVVVLIVVGCRRFRLRCYFVVMVGIVVVAGVVWCAGAGAGADDVAVLGASALLLLKPMAWKQLSIMVHLPMLLLPFHRHFGRC